MNYRFYRPSDTPPVSPFRNAGATCWWNALMQAVLGLTSFNELMRDPKSETGEAYAAMLRESIGGRYEDAPTRVLVALQRVCELPTGNGCAPEGLDEFLDAVKNQNAENLFHVEYEPTFMCSCGKKTVDKADIRHWIGVPATQPTLELARQSTAYLRTNVPPNHPMHGGMYIKNFQSTQEMGKWIFCHPSAHADRKCEACQQVTKNSIRIEQLAGIREIVVLRFDMSMRAEPTWFGPVITFPHVDIDGKRGKNLIYELCGVVEWGGGLNTVGTGMGGHYWAKTKRGGRWYMCDDMNVRECPMPEPNKNVLLVFYHLTCIA